MRKSVLITSIFIVLFLSLITSRTSLSDQIEFNDGSLIEGSVDLIESGFIYIKIDKKIVDKIEEDVIAIKSGIVIRGTLDSFQNETFTLKVNLADIKSLNKRASIQSDTASLTKPSQNEVIKIDKHSSSNEQVILRIHGSNTIGSKLAPELARFFLESLGSHTIETKSIRNEESVVQGKLKENLIAIEIHSHGSSTAFDDMVSGKCDIGMSSRKIKKDEMDKLIKLGDMTSIKNEHILGIDGIAVIVHKSNNIFKLQKSEVQQIFSGEYTNWSQFKGQSSEINIYARDDKSGTFDTFKTLVLDKKKLLENAKRYEDSRLLSDQVSSDVSSIGFIGLPYILNSKEIAISDGPGSPYIPPDIISIATEDYPLSRRLYLYTASKPSNPYVSKFIEFALSQKGQEVVDDNHFVGLNIKAVRPTPREDYSKEYADAIEQRERLSTVFRFRAGSFELDNRALRDIDRMVQFLKDKKYQIWLFGFADNAGDPQKNITLSKARAKKVQDELKNKNIIIPDSNITAFGQLNPVSSNDNDLGRERNRRVEVWVKPTNYSNTR